MVDWDQDLPLRTSKTVDVELLEFDQDNPRFTPDKRPEDGSDEAIITLLDRSSDLGELVQSIAFNGYIDIEPMIVYANEDGLVVLEGNRRLAAVKVLRSPELAAACRISTPKLTDEARASLDKVLVYRVEDKHGAIDLIGFKHINGPQAWDAYAKALYAMRWLDAERGKKDGLTLSEIAQRMGDKHDTLHRMVTAAYALKQAEDDYVYDLDDRIKRHFSFSHLYTGLTYPEFSTFLGMDRIARSEDPLERPVPADHEGELRQMLVWLYGSKREDTDPVVQNQASDLRRLKQVLTSQAATRELTERGDLGAAVVTATPASDLFAKNLIDAAASLRLAVDNSTGYDPELHPDMMEFAKLCVDRSDIVLGTMERRSERSKRGK
ncbi:hypothetical protein [Chachezhania antarctica]|uniref:hypothetical protein n=1 Tax=Chachezhania antarctica TaxID=2340860 RepID=UPI000EAC73EF|nr:hypothetical protein [Chachezhania antarctica]|tara:strand:- start:2388 stop:3527 length:1140 start_codon:yes stop_codon:yes gene_type:complete